MKRRGSDSGRCRPRRCKRESARFFPYRRRSGRRSAVPRQLGCSRVATVKCPSDFRPWPSRIICPERSEICRFTQQFDDLDFRPFPDKLSKPPVRAGRKFQPPDPTETLDFRAPSGFWTTYPRRYTVKRSLVPTEGVEPTHSFEYQILSLARLPIPPRRHTKAGGRKVAEASQQAQAVSSTAFVGELSALDLSKVKGYTARQVNRPMNRWVP